MAQNWYFATDTGGMYYDNGAVPLAIPNTFVGASPEPISRLDTNFTTVAGVVNAGQLLFGLLANRPAAVGAWVLVASANGLTAETLSGLTLSNDAGTPNTILDIAAGGCSSDDAVIGNRVLMTLAAFTKTTAAWVVGSGNGGLDTGAVGNATWYHVFVIQRPDTSVVDVLFSASATAPTMPANYTKKRRIGSFLTDGSAHILAFVQQGNMFLWGTTVLDFGAVNPGAAAVTRALTVPTGVVVFAQIMETLSNTGAVNATNSLISDLGVVDADPVSVFDVGSVKTVAGFTGTMMMIKSVRTNTSAQVRTRLSYSDANVTLFARTYGWIDERGRG